MNKNWPATWTVHLGPDYPVELPIMDLVNSFFIYCFDMTGVA